MLPRILFFWHHWFLFSPKSHLLMCFVSLLGRFFLQWMESQWILHSQTIDDDLKSYTHYEVYRCHTRYSFSGNVKPKKEKLNLQLGSSAAFDPFLCCQWNCLLSNLLVMVVNKLKISFVYASKLVFLKLFLEWSLLLCFLLYLSINL